MIDNSRNGTRPKINPLVKLADLKTRDSNFRPLHIPGSPFARCDVEQVRIEVSGQSQVYVGANSIETEIISTVRIQLLSPTRGCLQVFPATFPVRDSLRRFVAGRSIAKLCGAAYGTARPFPNAVSCSFGCTCKSRTD